MQSRRHRRSSGAVTLSAKAAFLRVAAVVAAVTGVPYRDIVEKAGPGTMRRPNVRFARTAAIYLTVTVKNVRQMRLARALQRHRHRIVFACHAIEEARDQPSLDELLSRMEEML